MNLKVEWMWIFCLIIAAEQSRIQRRMAEQTSYLIFDSAEKSRLLEALIGQVANYTGS